MANDNSSGNGNGGLYFIVGGLVVAVVVGVWMYTGGHFGTTKVEQTTSVPGIGSVTTTTTEKKAP